MFQASTMGADPYDWYINGGSSGNGSGMIDIGTVNGGTVYGSDSGGGNWWDNWCDNILCLGSQIISAWGRNPTQQIGSGQVTGIGGGYSPAQTAAQQAALLAQQNQIRNNPTGSSGGVGSTVGGGIDGIVNWAAANPIPVFLGIAGVFLLFRTPPGRR